MVVGAAVSVIVGEGGRPRGNFSRVRSRNSNRSIFKVEVKEMIVLVVRVVLDVVCCHSYFTTTAQTIKTTTTTTTTCGGPQWSHVDS